MAEIEELVAAERAKQPAIRRPPISSINDIPSIFDCGISKISYIQEPELPEGAIVAVTGDSGCGKSTLALGFAATAAESGRQVLILDRENPGSVVLERFERLGIRDGPTLHYWGGWLQGQAPGPGESIILTWIISCNPRPLVIIDSFIAFYDGNENDSAAVREWMNLCRIMANLGATVLVVHHTGKAESTQDYRGSSDFKAAIDAGFVVTNYGPPGRLGTMTLRCYKSRFGFAGNVVYRYADGRFNRQEAPVEKENVLHSALTALLRDNPGITATAFAKLASEKGYGRNKARSWLNEGVAIRKDIKCEPLEKNGSRYTLLELSR
jgi:hypothetical protein